MDVISWSVRSSNRRGGDRVKGMDFILASYKFQFIRVHDLSSSRLKKTRKINKKKVFLAFGYLIGYAPILNLVFKNKCQPSFIT